MRARIRTTTLLTATVVALLGTIAFAQPPAGLVNQAVAPLGLFSDDGPGWFYYGLNAADRGLGYNGSYMTLGGFIPYAEDDLGGLWAADLRSHLSVNGGFFSNIGAVRKQFIGGSLLGIGIYWDYDGDLNQYPVWGMPGTEVFGQFGHVYNQVGVSGEWLTDYGNLRSNGYIPVGSTGHTLGAPGNPFTGNYLLCQNGLDAALGGADLEVGVYVPGLADWAGMVSVGGYAFGNARYQWQEGSQLGQDLVPWFGGVYTRLDMTFIENWDFSLQANNDSFFDWTGFARLTYRMGGSRRRNVPDQVEQPIMRNEHIVRAHQTPIVAVNPVTNQPWRVIHVDNSAPAGGNGTAAAPVTALQFAQTRADRPYDVVFVHAGNSATNPYEAAWQFQADNQILVGQGSSLELNTTACGYRRFFGAPGARPVVTSDATAITLRNGAIVDHLRIENAPLGIAADASVTAAVNVNDVQLVGTNTSNDSGIALSGLPAGARVNLFNMDLQDMDLGLHVDGGAADVTFQGAIQTTNSASESILVENTSGGSITINRTADVLQTPVARNATFVVPYGIVDRGSQAAAPIVVQSVTNTAVAIGQASVETATNDGVLLSNNADSTLDLQGLLAAQVQGDGLKATGNTDTAITIQGLTIETPGAGGLVVEGNTNSTIVMSSIMIETPGATGVTVDGNTGSSVTFTDLLVLDAFEQAVLSLGNDAASTVKIDGFSAISSLSNTLAAFETNDAATLEVQLVALESAVPSATNGAVVLNGSSSGSLTITDLFQVANPAPPPNTLPGTATDDVTNTTSVIFTGP